jgi:hypothetical protein
MKFYQFGKEISFEDTKVREDVIHIPKEFRKIIMLREAVRDRSQNLALTVIKPLDLAHFDYVKNTVESKFCDTRLIYAESTN